MRNEITGATLTEVFKEIDRMRASASDGTELRGARQFLRGLLPVQTATQSGLANVLNNVYVFGLPKDHTEAYRGKIAALTPRPGEERRGRAAPFRKLRHRDRRRLRESERSARRLQGHHVPRR